VGAKHLIGDQQKNARQREAVAFLRDWLPDEAKDVYRAMIREDPLNWSRHPHFAGGIILKDALRGNGIDEKTLGVPDLNKIWPELLEAALDLSRERGKPD
jgi:hypothetical protein